MTTLSHPVFTALVDVGYPRPRVLDACQAWEAAGKPPYLDSWLTAFGVPLEFIRKALLKIGSTCMDMSDTFFTARTAAKAQRDAAEQAMVALKAHTAKTAKTRAKKLAAG